MKNKLKNIENEYYMRPYVHLLWATAEGAEGEMGVIMAKASSFGLTIQTFQTIIVQYQVNTGEMDLWSSNGMLHYLP